MSPVSDRLRGAAPRFAVVSVTALAWALGVGIAYYTPSWYGTATGVAVALVGTTIGLGTALSMVDLPEQADFGGET